MADEMWMNLVNSLRNQDIEFEAGLTDSEIETAEKRYMFQFPPDLRAFLQAGLPKGYGFPNWRNGEPDSITEWLDLPRRGILFDVEQNGFWLEDWGPRPKTVENAMQFANTIVQAAPKLIPIYLHRMIPSEPHLPGNPVFSVHQTDIIYYGINLRDYLIHEFLAREDIGIWPIPEDVRKVPFWDIEKFLDTRWSGGACVYDNSSRTLP